METESPQTNLKKLTQFSFDFDTKQIELSESQISRGMGLGLSLAYWFVKRLGGDLQIESRITYPDCGTRITLQLPLSTERQWERLAPLLSSYEG